MRRSTYTTAVIHTSYQPHPGSNVGRIFASCLNHTSQARYDQSLSRDENHRRVAQALADRLAAGGHILPEPVVEESDMTDSGGDRWFTAPRSAKR